MNSEEQSKGKILLLNRKVEGLEQSIIFTIHIIFCNFYIDGITCRSYRKYDIELNLMRVENSIMYCHM